MLNVRQQLTNELFRKKHTAWFKATICLQLGERTGRCYVRTRTHEVGFLVLMTAGTETDSGIVVSEPGVGEGPLGEGRVEGRSKGSARNTEEDDSSREHD